MICSMTAFSRREIKNTWGTATWELRSVNQRYLEIQFFLPEQFHCLEPSIRKRIQQCLTRGKVECRLYFNAHSDIQHELMFDKNLIKKLIEAAQWVKMQINEGEINPLTILSWPGVKITEEQNWNSDVINTELLARFDDAFSDFIHVRETEGAALKTMIKQRLANVTIELIKIRQKMPEILSYQRKRLLNKLEEIQIQLENNRLEQELVMLAQRTDVSEELDRLELHVKKIYQILTRKTPIGRRLDFMMQELNRESNTLGSKSVNTAVTESVIELKILIEQMREQIQNIE